MRHRRYSGGVGDRRTPFFLVPPNPASYEVPDERSAKESERPIQDPASSDLEPGTDLGIAIRDRRHRQPPRGCPCRVLNLKFDRVPAPVHGPGTHRHAIRFLVIRGLPKSLLELPEKPEQR